MKEAGDHKEKWFEKVKAKAAKRNIPVDSMLRLDAAYMVDNEGK